MKNLPYLLLLLCFLAIPLSFCDAQCVITLKPDATAGKDTEVYSLPCSSSGPCQTTNFGTELTLRSIVWTWGGTHASLRSLLEFDLSSLPAGCTVSNATLLLYNPGTINTQFYHCGQNSSIHPCISNVFGIHRITQPWNEMTTNWTNQPTFATAITGVDVVNVPNNDLPYNDYSIDLTTMVNYWLANPTQNHGMLLKQLDETQHYHGAFFATSDCVNPSLRPELVLTLSCPTICSNTIEGYVFNDLNGDCIQNGTDLPLQNWVVEILPGPYYASTDATGHYSAVVPDGSYSVNQHIPNNQIWDSLCPLPYLYNVNVSGATTVNANFVVETEVSCPILTVDVASSFLRKCHTENFIVSYCNNGNQTAQGVYIDVSFSNGLTPLSSNVPYTVNSPTEWSFAIGTLAPGACASFYVSTLVDCNANFGDYECVTAEILPYYPCSELPQDSTIVWDRSSVSVSGACIGDSLACFTITNNGSVGNGYMQGTSVFRIYENNSLVYIGTFQLLGGADTTICWPVGLGHAIRLEADQRPGHPGNSHPNAVVENCGVYSRLHNFGTALPEDDVAANVAQECAEVRSSYDPNDKEVIPAGIGTPHYVGQNIMLDYKIRFQNTGNDTAFTVVIEDVLSPWLDINSIQLGVSSHNCNFSIEGNRILKFTFNNIMLPDSNVNEPLSHGFVKFKVKQLPNVPLGTIINNSANIYFDFNAAVLTNNTFLTIEDMSAVMTNTVEPVYSKAQITVYPNPFNQSTTINVQDYDGTEPLIFELYNTLGALIQVIQTTERQFEIQRQQLASGVYFYRVSTEQQLLGSGKIIAE